MGMVREMSGAFDKLKSAVASEPVLQLLNFESPFAEQDNTEMPVQVLSSFRNLSLQINMTKYKLTTVGGCKAG